MSDSHAALFAPRVTVSRRNHVLGSNIDGEIVLMSAEHQSYFGLNRIGSAIWRGLAVPVQVEALHKDMATQFSGDTALIERETLAFLTLLLDRDLIAVQPARD